MELSRGWPPTGSVLRESATSPLSFGVRSAMGGHPGIPQRHQLPLPTAADPCHTEHQPQGKEEFLAFLERGVERFSWSGCTKEGLAQNQLVLGLY